MSRVVDSKVLKGLQVQLEKIRGDMKAKSQFIASLNTQKRDAEKALNDLKSREGQVLTSIKALEEDVSEVVVSEHAILRYLERVKGIDIEEVKKEILTDSLANQIDKLGNGHYPVAPNAKVVVKGRVIVSVIGDIEKGA